VRGTPIGKEGDIACEGGAHCEWGRRQWFDEILVKGVNSIVQDG
jgi:hypothetical protein